MSLSKKWFKTRISLFSTFNSVGIVLESSVEDDTSVVVQDKELNFKYQEVATAVKSIQIDITKNIPTLTEARLSKSSFRISRYSL